jgi:hypothetical protein
MNIGGIDIEIPTNGINSPVNIAIQAIESIWPYLIVSTYDHYGVDEFFVYRDLPSFDIWNREGAVPEAYNRMIYIIEDDDVITLAIDDDKDEQMKQIINAISLALSKK